MSTEEGIIWGKFLTKFGKDYQRFDYDLRVGDGIPTETDIEYIFKDDYAALTRKRIDAVGYNNLTATIFEVKQRANFNAIGQLLGYRDLFLKSFPKYSVDDLILICSTVSEEDKSIIEKNGILIVIII